MRRSIEEIPLPYRGIFTDYNCFNPIQSEVLNDVYHTNKSIILSAPTGSGKTVIFELAIIRLVLQEEKNFMNYNDFKAVYVAPIKALCSERFTDWSEKFHKFGMKCLELTGDTEIQDISEITSANIIITTPEKWDSLTRKWRDFENIVTIVKLFMIDEVHLLNEDIRGATLEAIVSRMKTIQCCAKSSNNEALLRFICVSATIPNIEDLAEWIGGKDKNSIKYFRFSEDERPVKLEKHILSYSKSSSSFKFDISLNYKLAKVIRKYSKGKPTLIFCSSRKSVEMASTVLEKSTCLSSLSETQKSELLLLSKRLQDIKLHKMILKGIAFHHAGLTYNDRSLIEENFRKGLILILLSTNTLAMGVNLPAHLVIIKSTESFINGSVIEYSQNSILQMIGRAGRPQFDVSGVAVIMTQSNSAKKYENLVNGGVAIESRLHKNLAEHLNSEIVLQTITNLDVAMKWIRSTFLYVRACKAPKNYGLTCDSLTKERIEKKLEELCLIQINSLEANELITKDQIYGLSIKATQYGRLMARYYISLDTMILFRKIRGNESYLELFNLIIESKEFSEFTLRVNEKKILNELNETPIRYPIKGKIKTNSNKASCLIQANFGTIQIPDPSMQQDSIRMIRIGERISKCCLEFIRLNEKQFDNNFCGCYKALLNCMHIAKSYSAKLWENSEHVCKQLHKIGNVFSTLLVNSGKTTFKSILETNPRALEMILGKTPPFGNEIHNAIHTFPDYQLTLTMKGSCLAHVCIAQLNINYQYNSNTALIVGDSDNKLILYHENVDTTIQEFGLLERTFKIPNLKVNSVFAHLVHDYLVGVDKCASIELNPKPYNNNDDTSNLNDGGINCVSRAPKKKHSKKSTRDMNTFDSLAEEYEMLTNDDEIFTDISIHDYRRVSVTSKSKYSLENYENRSKLKRKLSNFEFKEKSKISKFNNFENNSNIIETYDNDDEIDFLMAKLLNEEESIMSEEQIKFQDENKFNNDLTEFENMFDTSWDDSFEFDTSNDNLFVAQNEFIIEKQTKLTDYYDNKRKNTNIQEIENYRKKLRIDIMDNTKNNLSDQVIDLSVKHTRFNESYVENITMNIDNQVEPIDYSTSTIKSHNRSVEPNRSIMHFAEQKSFANNNMLSNKFFLPGANHYDFNFDENYTQSEPNYFKMETSPKTNFDFFSTKKSKSPKMDFSFFKEFPTAQRGNVRLKNDQKLSDDFNLKKRKSCFRSPHPIIHIYPNNKSLDFNNRFTTTNIAKPSNIFQPKQSKTNGINKPIVSHKNEFVTAKEIWRNEKINIPKNPTGCNFHNHTMRNIFGKSEPIKRKSEIHLGTNKMPSIKKINLGNDIKIPPQLISPVQIKPAITMTTTSKEIALKPIAMTSRDNSRNISFQQKLTNNQIKNKIFPDKLDLLANKPVESVDLNEIFQKIFTGNFIENPYKISLEILGKEKINKIFEHKDLTVNEQIKPTTQTKPIKMLAMQSRMVNIDDIFKKKRGNIRYFDDIEPINSKPVISDDLNEIFQEIFNGNFISNSNKNSVEIPEKEPITKICSHNDPMFDEQVKPTKQIFSFQFNSMLSDIENIDDIFEKERGHFRNFDDIEPDILNSSDPQSYSSNETMESINSKPDKSDDSDDLNSMLSDIENISENERNLNNIEPNILNFSDQESYSSNETMDPINPYRLQIPKFKTNFSGNFNSESDRSKYLENKYDHKSSEIQSQLENDFRKSFMENSFYNNRLRGDDGDYLY